MKKFYMKTFGCQMNVYDGQRITSMLIDNGWTQTDDMPDADLIILNTCAVREKATDKAFSALGRIRKHKKPSAIFGMTGCSAREAGADAFRRIPELNFVLGPQSYHKLQDILDNPDLKLFNIDLGGLEKFDKMPKMHSSDKMAYIPIQEGCNHHCTYCIVPYTRGREVSRPVSDIMTDVQNATDNGALEICFLGQNVNGYKWSDESDKQFKLSDLIKTTAKIESIKRIRFTSSYPTEMTDDLIELFGHEPKLLPMLHLPIQSGSQNVLTRMNRPYSPELYIEIMNKLHKACPEIQISSDFIVGFPGETDSDFQKTLEIIKSIKFIASYCFMYSKRPHTAAERMDNQLPLTVKKERLKIIDTLLNDHQRTFNESCIGKTFECLCEGDDKSGDNLIFRTPYMQQCIVKKSDDIVPGIMNIKITDANKSSLRGEIIN